MKKKKFTPNFETFEKKNLLSSIGISDTIVPLPQSFDLGNDPPITDPPLPSTGPSGPGSSS